MTKNHRKTVSLIGKSLGNLRSEKNMTQKELAERLGIKRSALSRIENGKEPGLTLNKYLLIISALGQNPQSIGELLSTTLSLIKKEVDK
jgi:transcriptional regulator with XRE-family HTH domain